MPVTLSTAGRIQLHIFNLYDPVLHDQKRVKIGRGSKQKDWRRKPKERPLRTENIGFKKHSVTGYTWKEGDYKS